MLLRYVEPVTLYEQLTSFESLYQAFLRARKGKRKLEEIAAFERSLEPNLFEIQPELQAQTYQPGGCYSFYRTEAKRISPDLTGLTRVSGNQNLYAEVNPHAQVTS